MASSSSFSVGGTGLRLGCLLLAGAALPGAAVLATRWLETSPGRPGAGWLVLPALVAGLGILLLGFWAMQPLRRGLVRIERSLDSAERSEGLPPSLPASGVLEVDRALSSLRQWLEDLRGDALLWKAHLARGEASTSELGTPAARSPAALAGLHGLLQAHLQRQQLLLSGWQDYLRRVHQEGQSLSGAWDAMPPAWRDHPQVQPAVGLMRQGDDALMQSVQQMTHVVERNSMTLAELSWQARSINQAMTQLATNGGQVVESSQLLAQSAGQVSAQAAEVGEKARQAQQSSQQGQQELQEAIAAMRTMGRQTREAGEAMSRLQESSRKIEHIVQLIREIADKINLLSLNAAIEAARAGEHGRGFAVVAQEVRNLAEKTFAATHEIDATVAGIMRETGQAVHGINTLLSQVQDNVVQIEHVGERLDGILNFSGVLSGNMEGMAGASETSTRQVHDISGFLGRMQAELLDFGQRIQAQETQIEGLTELSEGFFDQLVAMRFETTHSRMYRVARAAADSVQLAFEQALAQGRIQRGDLFSDALEPMAGTQPTKYRSPFDAFTDQVLPAIQEAVLSEQPTVVFAICTHRTGYVPTHNLKFSQPLTGRHEVDLVNSRTKRIFGDRTGMRCATHTKKMLLQTYKRDTGEIMHDLSVPLWVDGTHWGGFRMGYKAD